MKAVPSMEQVCGDTEASTRSGDGTGPPTVGHVSEPSITSCEV
jgi:hypothetical protein